MAMLEESAFAFECCRTVDRTRTFQSVTVSQNSSCFFCLNAWLNVWKKKIKSDCNFTLGVRSVAPHAGLSITLKYCFHWYCLLARWIGRFSPCWLRKLPAIIFNEGFLSNNALHLRRGWESAAGPNANWTRATPCCCSVNHIKFIFDPSFYLLKPGSYLTTFCISLLFLFPVLKKSVVIFYLSLSLETFFSTDNIYFAYDLKTKQKQNTVTGFMAMHVHAIVFFMQILWHSFPLKLHKKFMKKPLLCSSLLPLHPPVLFPILTRAQRLRRRAKTPPVPSATPSLNLQPKTTDLQRRSLRFP